MGSEGSLPYPPRPPSRSLPSFQHQVWTGHQAPFQIELKIKFRNMEDSQLGKVIFHYQLSLSLSLSLSLVAKDS
jgi:hypothetical protein